MLICTFYQKNVDETEIFELYHVDHLHQTFTYFISLSSSSGNFKAYIYSVHLFLSAIPQIYKKNLKLNSFKNTKWTKSLC